MPILIDKVTVKAWVTRKLGADWVTPTLWHGTELPPEPRWETPFVVKSRHGCNQSAFVRSGKEDWSSIRRQARRWTRRAYAAGWLDEWAYGELSPGLLVEPFIGTAGKLPIDYKFYVFGGSVAFVQVHLDREHAHRWILLDRDWRRVSSPTKDADPPRPTSLSQMIKGAETLGEGFSFVRVDLYAILDRPMFGEMTFYPSSGLDPFSPDSLDQRLGSYWLNALRSEAGTTSFMLRELPTWTSKNGAELEG